MKRKVKIWFPVWSTHEAEAEVDIPDGENPENWLKNNEQDLIEGHGLCETDIEGALDLGIAGSKFINPPPPGEKAVIPPVDLKQDMTFENPPPAGEKGE